MKGRSALPRGAFLIGLLVVGLGAAGARWGRHVLRRISYFDVRRVEVVGSRFVAPDSVLLLASIGRDRSVWDDFSDVERRLSRHPLIRNVRVHRKGLRSLRLVTTEVEPVALVGAPELRAVEESGQMLPIDPTRTELDLPVLTTEASFHGNPPQLERGPARDALGIFSRLRTLDPGLASGISDFQLGSSGGLLANLEKGSQPAASLTLPGHVDETLTRRIRATLADLRSRDIYAEQVEARFMDQIVVRTGQPRRQDRVES